MMETMAIQCSLSIVHKTPISKINRANWNRDVAHVEEHLICKHDVPSSNPTFIKKMHTHAERGGINVNNVGKPLVSPGEFDIN
jgi:hypothetical protein